MKQTVTRSLLLAALALPACVQAAAEPDPNGVLRKPIPDKLVVLTFDDGCASGYTVAAPMLKSLGFGGSFYVCDFDSFKTRKDWYLTWRQMKAMANDGFEIGNHTVGHGGSLEAFMAMEDQLLAHDVVPKPTTVCWPLYNVAWDACPELAKNGYTFGRGGYFQQPYRPTVDNPFDVPSYTLNDGTTMQAFIKIVRRAVNGKVVVLTYHGVPDMEHAAVSVKPETFKVMMEYLKDNHYQAIAMRDLAAYIDPAKAAKLPQKSGEFKEPDPVALATEDKPYIAPPAKDIQEFGFPNLPATTISKTSISVTVPYTTDVTSLMPNIKVADGATVAPASGTKSDFSKPQSYTVTSRDGSKITYTVTVDKTAISEAKEILTFGLPGATSVTVAGSGIGVYVPNPTDLTALTPTFTLPPYATAVPASGTTRDFTKPQTYTVTAQDGSSRVFTVTVVKSAKPNAFTWGGGDGKLGDATKWSNTDGAATAPAPAGQPDYILNFTKPGNCAVVNDLQESFQLNQLNFGVGQGNTTKLDGKGLTFTRNRVTDLLPGIRVNAIFERTSIANPITLETDLSVRMRDGCEMEWKGLISGAGALILDPLSPQPDAGNYGFRPCVLQISNRNNTYTGGTIINGGRLMVYAANQGLGTGPVTLGEHGQLRLDSVEATSPLTSYGGLIEGGPSWDAPITLNGNTRISGNFSFNRKNGGMSGRGGLTLVGGRGPWGWENNGTVSLYGTNTYTGPTSVLRGTLQFKKAASLYNANPAPWTPANISVATSATLAVNVGGKDEFTGRQVGTLLTNLTTGINHNGLMIGSCFCMDTANATDQITIPSNITDSKGNGGGWFFFKKVGGGTVELTGANTYTGQTFFEGGTLIVSSLNSVAKGKATSSLGAPITPETGLIGFGGDCTLTYTGAGEVTDRIMDLTGQQQTVTFDQAGTGLLRFTSSLDTSGYGHAKALVLKGSTVGKGEFAGSIRNPHDRKNEATLALTKTGTGTWALSGVNSYTGPTTVTQGTLSLTNTRSLGGKADVYISEGATLDLNFEGEMRIGMLYLDGKPQPPGKHGAANAPKYIHGKGILMN
ncbi:MAG: autotransporter-associated beta strand repeat-containing protein [Verrucomicrobia bacterium]|nr:autotransporter-associated beta strand repeat-containing protein [Verrucomicrobiota bacterium]